MRELLRATVTGFCLAACSAAALGADRWTEFRGPAGTGHAGDSALPREWTETKNVAWKVPVHGRGWSSPVVLGGQVWLTTATRDGRELSVLAFDAATGRTLHDILLFRVDKPEDTARFNSFASPTPVIEEGRVYVHFGSYGTAALDTKTAENALPWNASASAARRSGRSSTTSNRVCRSCAVARNAGTVSCTRGTNK